MGGGEGAEEEWERGDCSQDLLPWPGLPSNKNFLVHSSLLNQERYEKHDKKQIAKANPPQN
eukprot:722174-Hanusia_phi.AAC.1